MKMKIEPGDRVDLTLKNAVVKAVTDGPTGGTNLYVQHAACYLAPGTYVGTGNEGVVINDETVEVTRVKDPLPTTQYSVIVDDEGLAYHLSDHGNWISDTGDRFAPSQIENYYYRVVYDHGKGTK